MCEDTDGRRYPGTSAYFTLILIASHPTLTTTPKSTLRMPSLLKPLKQIFRSRSHERDKRENRLSADGAQILRFSSDRRSPFQNPRQSVPLSPSNPTAEGAVVTPLFDSASSGQDAIHGAPVGQSDNLEITSARGATLSLEVVTQDADCHSIELYHHPQGKYRHERRQD